MAISTKQALTADEFWELPEIPGKRLQLVAGEVVEAPGATWLHGALVTRLFSWLTAYAVSNRPGQVFGDGMTYLLAREPDTIRIPELSFIPADRLPPGRAPQRYVDAIPALVVEIVSPSNSAPDLRRRIRDYLEAGVSAIWVLWPGERVVSVYANSMSPKQLTADDALDGGDVLPGFSVKVAALFDIEW
ncbi:MAG TPA: Uma2 family endonuclease [Thermomicrobiales bacterium]|nr:Uma2 family endonuclease [Thermomicrobiales bacterium]